MVAFESLGSFTASADVSAQHSIVLTQLVAIVSVVVSPVSIAWIWSYLSAPWGGIVTMAAIQVLGIAVIAWWSQN